MLIGARGTRDYVIRMPKDLTVVAACNEVRCENWQFGWDTILDERTAEGREAAAWIRSGASGRDFTELHGPDVTVFRFAAHQRCFEEHRTKPARWLAGGRQHADMSGWIDDLDQHVGRLAEQIRKG